MWGVWARSTPIALALTWNPNFANSWLHYVAGLQHWRYMRGHTTVCRVGHTLNLRRLVFLQLQRARRRTKRTLGIIRRCPLARHLGMPHGRLQRLCPLLSQRVAEATYSTGANYFVEGESLAGWLVCCCFLPGQLDGGGSCCLCAGLCHLSALPHEQLACSCFYGETTAHLRRQKFQE